MRVKFGDWVERHPVWTLLSLLFVVVVVFFWTSENQTPVGAAFSKFMLLCVWFGCLVVFSSLDDLFGVGKYKKAHQQATRRLEDTRANVIASEIKLEAMRQEQSSFKPSLLGNSASPNLFAISPKQFEHFCADLLNRSGYVNMRVVGGAGDLQADIVGEDQFGRSTIVQCKQYSSSNIGSAAIQSFIGMKEVHHKAEIGIFMTTSWFTNPAIELAKRHGILLIDNTQLREMTERSYGSAKNTQKRFEILYCPFCGADVDLVEADTCEECGWSLASL